MGFLKGAWDAAKGSLGAGFANQWLEYMTVPQGFDGQALVGRAMPMKKEGSANNDGQEDAFIISDGSRFEVPENTALILVENGGITAVVAEPGRYTYTMASLLPPLDRALNSSSSVASQATSSWHSM